MPSNPEAPPQLIGESDRLLIRTWQLPDAPAWQRVSEDEGLNRFTIFGYRQATVAAAEEFIRREQAVFAREGRGRWPLFLKNSTGEELIGTVSMRYVSFDESPERVETELGYRLAASHWGRGYATEAGKLLIAYGKSLGLPEIVAFAVPDNQASLRVLKKIGMQFRSRGTFEGHAVEIYALRT